ncbi:MAG TPA: choice-of-anchor D domain-containing protein, partial [Bryobacterales bacterium]|nr:choice-of-anchor D domain-containing protein [Bryobacterales bacterium]
ATGMISVAFDSANSANEATLSPGAATNFGFGCVNSPTLFNGTATLNGSYTGTYSYRVFVPAGSTGLQVRTDTSSSADIDLYVRASMGVVSSAGGVTADARAEGPGTPKIVNITSTSIQAGAWYYIALRLASTRINSGVTGTIIATVSGPPAVISVTPASLDFGAVSVGQTKDLPLTIANSSVTVLKVTAISVSSTQFTFTAPAVPFNVAANGQQSITARFQPSAAGPQTASLIITSNDPAHLTTVITLTGSGQATGGPAIGVSVSTLNFGSAYGSDPPPQTFTVSNSGGGTLNFQIATSQPWLSVSPAAGASTGAAVTITATARGVGLIAGTYNGQIQVSQAAAASQSSGAVLQTSSVTIAVTLTITAQPGATPAISAGGIVNAASFKPADLPGGAIAQGSIFTIFGVNLGPPTLVSVSAFPLQTNLAGVQIAVTQGSTTVNAIPLAAVATQINAIMPSNAPTGQVQITAAYNGRASAPVTAQVASTGFGVFTVNSGGTGPGIFFNFNSQTDQPLNSTTHSATPGQVVTAWGTGLGPISGPDNQAPPVGNLPGTVDILVGNKTVTDKLYNGRSAQFSGVDQVIFRIPPDAPQGCYVPVLIRVNGVPGNATTMAIDPNGAPCSDPANPFSRYTIRGGKLGVLSLLRASLQLQLDPTSATLTSLALDAGLGIFADEPSGEFRFDPLTALPPAGSCTTLSTSGISVTSLLGGNIPVIPTTARILDAGPALPVSGPNGNRSIPRTASGASGTYFGLLGSSLPLPGLTSSPLYLDPGSYTITGPGGADVGSFTAKLTLPPVVTWTNEAQLLTVDRSQGATLTWTGGDPASQGMLILATNIDNVSGVAAALVCTAPNAAGTFTIPPAILSTLPASNPQQPAQFTGLLLLGALPVANLPTFTAPGLDAGYDFFAQLIGTSTVFK